MRRTKLEDYIRNAKIVKVRFKRLLVSGPLSISQIVVNELLLALFELKAVKQSHIIFWDVFSICVVTPLDSDFHQYRQAWLHFKHQETSRVNSQLRTSFFHTERAEIRELIREGMCGV